MNNNLLTGYEITPKRKRILDAYDNIDKKEYVSPYEIAKIADVSVRYVYDCLSDPAFINLLRLKTTGVFISSLLPVSKRVVNDALKGKFMQQQLALECAGIKAKEPYINVIINQVNPSENLDNSIMSKIIDVSPQPVNNSDDVK